MGLFKRANWHSGLTYEQTCDSCKTVVRYTDHKLDFRPWYADGFVYCPKCEKPLRHRETYAIDKNDITQESTTIPLNVAFCGNCGNKFGDNDLFCSKCGNKR